MEEVWKDIPGYEGMYQVSSEGRVKSLERYVEHPRYGLQLVREKYLMLNKNKGGYFIIGLNKSANRKTYKVHKLVAITFLNHKPSGHNVVVDHINNDRSDNRLSNLQLTTNRENTSKDRKPNSGLTGVTKRKSGRYRSIIYHKKMVIYLGTFDTAEEAHQAYLNRIKEIEG